MSQAPSVIGMMKMDERIRALKKYQRNSYALATELLGYDLLTEDFHKPMMDEDDRRTALRASGKYHLDELDMWARDYYKTTKQVTRCVQAYLRDPETTITWWHAVEEIAQEAATEVGKHFQKNTELRRLIPEWRPAVNNRRWLSAKGFNFVSNKDKAPSMRAWGAGSEATGGHSHIGILDDIIGYNDIEDSLMPKKRRWYGRTVRNVIRTGIGRIWATGTHWDLDDIWSDFKKSKDWDIRIRGCYEKDGVPDWNGEPVLYTRKQIEKKRRGMSEYEFSCQMMNDPMPDSARLWHPDACEHYCTLAEAAGPGVIFVLSDPAPAGVGSGSGIGEKQRGDGSKDYWSIAVVKLKLHGTKQLKILLDGEADQDWTPSEGLKKAAELMRKWGTDKFINEAYGGLGADYTQDMIRVCNEVGQPLYLEKNGAYYGLPKYLDSYAAKAKNNRFAALCDIARKQEFLICETVPREFLEGDGDKVGLLPQGRNWRSLHQGRNSLRFDDHADVTSRITDSKLQEFAPQPLITTPFDFAEDEEDVQEYRSLYCGV